MLLVDFSVLFVRVSAFVLMAGRVLPQLALRHSCSGTLGLDGVEAN